VRENLPRAQIDVMRELTANTDDGYTM